MALNASLLRTSFEIVVEREPRLTEKFYDRLFKDCPALAPLFRESNRTSQEEMLGSALSNVLDHLEDATWLSSELRALGARHVGYGVTDSMYSQVGACLLATLSEVAGPDWTAELEAEWSHAYEAIAGLMIDGGASSQEMKAQ